MTLRRAARAAALSVIGLVVLGCSADKNPPAAPAPQVKTVTVAYDDLLNQKRVTRAVTLATGDTLRISLASNASTGYQWAPQAQISDGRVLSQTGHETVSADGPPGSAGAEVWTLRALTPGAATLTMTYGQPWPGGAKDAWTFTAQVTVR
ncbi:MAG TPA: protease inhibitor I42 family protein [Mycobacterium sp.]|nr:protease inhibitor I42 family protein [Mycobacterium sp.]